MTLCAIVAISENNAIGKEGGIPWYLPAELAYFKRVTMGYPIIMGRKTHESIGKTLPGRLNVVISRDSSFVPEPDSVLVGSLDEALILPEVISAKKAFVIGGESIYAQALPQVDELYLTKVHANFEGDKFFNWDKTDWQLVSIESHKKDDKNPYDYDMCLYRRRH